MSNREVYSHDVKKARQLAEASIISDKVFQVSANPTPIATAVESLISPGQTMSLLQSLTQGMNVKLTVDTTPKALVHDTTTQAPSKAISTNIEPKFQMASNQIGQVNNAMDGIKDVVNKAQTDVINAYAASGGNAFEAYDNQSFGKTGLEIAVQAGMQSVMPIIGNQVITALVTQTPTLTQIMGAAGNHSKNPAMIAKVEAYLVQNSPSQAQAAAPAIRTNFSAAVMNAPMQKPQPRLNVDWSALPNIPDAMKQIMNTDPKNPVQLPEFAKLVDQKKELEGTEVQLAKADNDKFNTSNPAEVELMQQAGNQDIVNQMLARLENLDSVKEIVPEKRLFEDSADMLLQSSVGGIKADAGKLQTLAKDCISPEIFKADIGSAMASTDKNNIAKFALNMEFNPRELQSVHAFIPQNSMN